MGKPFLAELSRLEETYAWAAAQDTSFVSDFLRAALDRSLVAVGSGGSFSAALYAAYLHQQLSGIPSEALTPMAFVGFSGTPDVAALFLSAGGRNNDILGALRAASSRDIRQVGAVSLRDSSPLSELAEKARANLFSASPPVGSDGFLATNSLVAFFGLIFRAASSIQPAIGRLPTTFKALSDRVKSSSAALARVATARHIVVLHGPSTVAAAADLESKLHEAGLAAVQVADFRNFAHGRHNWVAKNKSDTAVIAFVTPELKAIADATLRILEKEVPVAAVRCTGPASLHSFAALHTVFETTRLAGQARGIDPGRPGVPAFGRRIYNLRGFREVPPVRHKVDLEVAVQRKAGHAWTILAAPQRAKWLAAGTAYFRRLREAAFGAIVFDFDGTLCATSERFQPLCPDVAFELEQLLRAGVTIGIATGRGKSVRQQIRQSLPRLLWDNVWIGYYNGSEIGQLEDDSIPNRDRPVTTALNCLIASIKQDGTVRTLAKVELRPSQLTLEPTVSIGLEELYRHAFALAHRVPYGLKVLVSSHSVDIIPAGVSKRAVVRHVSTSSSMETLCIGDAGQYPGNDYELLSEPYSLSCDQVSADSLTCWNFAPPSVRGVEATLFYLKHTVSRNGKAVLRLPLDKLK